MFFVYLLYMRERYDSDDRMRCIQAIVSDDGCDSGSCLLQTAHVCVNDVRLPLLLGHYIGFVSSIRSIIYSPSLGN